MESNKNLIHWVLAVTIFATLVFSFISRENKISPEEIGNVKNIKIAGEELNVEVAVTPEARTQGLSYRTGLKEKDSMLFVFDNPGFYSFWMKDMNFPIDIIWINEEMRVVYIKENAQPSSYPEAFSPTQKALFVLETVAGFSAKNNLKVGDTVVFDF